MQTLLTYVISIDRGAELTSIAAAGSNLHYGLPGISRPQKPQATLSVGSHTFVAVEHPSYEIQNSTWDRRAWTFQEALLSRRRLVFTDSQVYFQCLRMHCTEGIEHSHTLVYGALRDDMRAFPRRGIGHQAPDIYNRLKEYYKRQLSFNADILNAVSGILQTFTQMRAGEFKESAVHFYGIPVVVQSVGSPGIVRANARASFALGLVWMINMGSHYTSPNVERSVAGDDSFPSWSWASFKANRPNSGSDHLNFFQGGRSPSDFDGPRQVRVVPRPGLSMSLEDYVQRACEFTAFLPLVELTSMVMPGLLLGKDTGLAISSACSQSIRFSALPQANLSLHLYASSITTNLTAVYVGGPRKQRRSEVVLILVEAIDESQYRQVGVCVLTVVEDDWFEQMNKSSASILQEQSDGREWEWLTLRLV
jgi:hypothetical protein